MTAITAPMRRLGRFTIDRETIERRPADALAMLAGCIVVRAELHWTGHVEYTALCGAFDEVPEGSIPPLYLARLSRDLDGTPHFDRWERAA